MADAAGADARGPSGSGRAVLKIADIRVEPAAAARGARLDQGKISEYAEAYSSGDIFPPPVVFHDPEGVAWLGDGLHRLRALSRIARVSVECDVRSGTRADAEWYAAGANGAHGLPLTREQRRLAVKLALQARPDASDRQIAEHCRVTHPTVGAVRRELVNLTSSGRTGKDGKTRKLPQRKKSGPVEKVSPDFDEILYPDAEPGLGALDHIEAEAKPSIWDGCDQPVPPEVAVAATAAQDADGDEVVCPACDGEAGMLDSETGELIVCVLCTEPGPSAELECVPVLWGGDQLAQATARQVVEAVQAGETTAHAALLELERRLGAQEQEIATLREAIAGMTPDPESDDRDAELNAAQREALDLRAKVRDLEESTEVQRQAHERDVIASLRGRARSLGEADRASATTRTPEQVLAALRIDGVLQVYADARGPVDGSVLDRHAADLGRRHAARRPYSRPEAGIFLRDLAGLSGAESLHLPAAEIERLRQIYLAARKAAR